MISKQECPKCGEKTLEYEIGWKNAPDEDNVLIFSTVYYCVNRDCNLRIGYGSRVERSYLTGCHKSSEGIMGCFGMETRHE